MKPKHDSGKSKISPTLKGNGKAEENPKMDFQALPSDKGMENDKVAKRSYAFLTNHSPLNSDIKTFEELSILIEDMSIIEWAKHKDKLWLPADEVEKKIKKIIESRDGWKEARLRLDEIYDFKISQLKSKSVLIEDVEKIISNYINLNDDFTDRILKEILQKLKSLKKQ